MSNFEISDSEFKRFSDLVYQKTGINLHYGKKQLLQSRVNKVLRKRGILSYKDYFTLIVNDNPENELHEVINLISTNVTHFFREERDFEFLRDGWAKEILAKGTKTVDIWSAACSSGEEPYSIAITLKELFGDTQIVSSILASDISTKVLNLAQKAIYPKERIDNINKELIKKYFQEGTKSAQGYIKVKDDIKRMINYKRINLIEAFDNINSFDIIFCRNVMIYFDLPTKEMIVNKLYEHVKPGGYIFVGHSESLNGLNSKFKYVMPATYKKE